MRLSMNDPQLANHQPADPPISRHVILPCGWALHLHAGMLMPVPPTCKLIKRSVSSNGIITPRASSAHERCSLCRGKHASVLRDTCLVWFSEERLISIHLLVKCTSLMPKLFVKHTYTYTHSHKQTDSGPNHAKQLFVAVARALLF